MALDAYMVFIPGAGDPFPIEGESSDAGAQTKNIKPFEIIDFKWGASAVAKETKKTGTSPHGDTGTTGPGTKARSIHVDTFSVSKPFDTASLSLFRACTTEDCTFSKAQVVFRKFGADGDPHVYLMFEFKKVRVDKIEWKIAAIEGGDKPDQEDIDFSFEQVNVYYTPQSAAGDKMKEVKKTASYTQTSGKQDSD